MNIKVECTGCGKDCSHAYGTHQGAPYHFGCLPMKRAKAKMRHCFNCGVELGEYADYDRLDTCGKPECESEAHRTAESERAEAHEQLDRDRGWP